MGALTYCFAENCMKMKEFGARGGGVSGAPLNPPMKMEHMKFIIDNIVNSSLTIGKLNCYGKKFSIHISGYIYHVSHNCLLQIFLCNRVFPILY